MLLAALLALAPAASAEEEAEGWVTLAWTPVQLGIAPGYGQVFSKPTRVYGLRLSGLYGIQSEVVGIDAGLFNDAGTFTGVGTGFCNVARAYAVGAQLGVGCNQVEENFQGLQAGMMNIVSKELTGLQIGFSNGARSGRGVQIGMVNSSDDLKGVQLGLINLNRKGLLKFLPGINVGW